MRLLPPLSPRSISTPPLAGRLLACAVTSCAMLGGLLLAPARAVPPSVTSPPATSQPPAEGAQAAEEALAEVVGAFAPAPRTRKTAPAAPRELTPAMLQLQRRLDDLEPGDRAVAAGYLARPSSPTAADVVAYAPEADLATECGPQACVTFARATRDAPPPDDLDGNGVADQVDQTLSVLADVWARVVATGGYRAPLDDGGAYRGEGPDERFDVYLADLGRFGVYGYCLPDLRAQHRRATSGYCVLDDDYASSQFPGQSSTENLQVTLAHEFFHAVQFAYDAFEDLWLMEGTAAWIEDELFDDINDNLFYLDRSPLTHPGVSMDDARALRNPYGSWIWWRFLSERHPWTQRTGMPTVIRDIWRRAAASSSGPGAHSAQATARVLVRRGDTMRRAVGSFFAANRRPERSYEEGASYPTAPLTATHRLSPSEGSVTSAVVLDQLSGATVAFIPDAALTSHRWRLAVAVSAPPRARGSVAHLTLHRGDGRSSTFPVRLDRRGSGRVTVPFSARAVRAVELTLANGSVRFTCDQGSTRSCAGTPVDHRLTTSFSASLRRR